MQGGHQGGRHELPVTTLSALQANLSAANTAVSLCRANIGQLAMRPGEWDDTGARTRKQIDDREAMILEMTRPETRKRCSPILNSRQRRLAKEGQAAAQTPADR